MPLSSRIEDELANFILYGGMMSRKARQLTAQVLFRHFYDPTFDGIQAISSPEFLDKYPHWSHLLQRLMGQAQLKELTLNNEDMAFSVTREALDWSKNIYQQFEGKFGLYEEQREWDFYNSQVNSGASESWSQLIRNLSARYPRTRPDWQFYRTRFDELSANLDPQNPQNLENQLLSVLMQNILEDWKEVMQKQRNRLEKDFLEGKFNAYYNELTQKVEQLYSLGNLIAPYYNFLNQAWGQSLGSWNRINWDKLKEFARTLEKDPRLRELANMLGKWHSEKSMKIEEELSVEISRPNWKPNPIGQSEIKGVHHSDHLSALLPAEVALLSSEETEWIFAKNYVEKKLLTFKYASFDAEQDNQKKEEKIEKQQRDDRGPVILNIDTSGSMFGGPERIAKALALAVLELVLKQKREAYLISFSQAIQTIHLNDLKQDFNAMIDFLLMSFHGGTDIQPALRESLRKLDEQGFENADILVISDFVIPRIDKQLFEKIEQYRQEKGTHFHSLHITRRPDSRAVPLAIFDQHWIYDIENPGIIRQTMDFLDSTI